MIKNFNNRNMDSISTRFEKLSELTGVGICRISAELGLSRMTLTQMKKSKNGIPSEYLRKIIERYPHVNLYYLVTGEGEIVKERKIGTDIETKCREILSESLYDLEQAELAILRMKTRILNGKYLKAEEQKTESVMQEKSGQI